MKIFNKFLTLIFSIGFIPIIPAIVFLFYYTYSGKQEILNFHENLAYISANIADENLAQLNIRLQYLDAIRNLYKSDSDFLKYIIEKNTEFIFVSLLDENGYQKATEGIRPFKKLFYYIDIENKLKNIKNSESNFIVSEIRFLANIPAMSFIYKLESGEILYIVADIRSLFNKIYFQKIGGTGFACLADSNGMVFPYNKYLPIVNSFRLKSFFTKESGKLEEIATNEVEYIGAFSKLKNFNIFVLTLQTKQEAFRWVNFITFLIVFLILSILTIFYFIALIAAKNVSYPINSLIEGAYRISKGNFLVPVKSYQKISEFNLLISVFNMMMKEIEKYHKINLEKIMDEKEKTDLLMKVINDAIILAEFTGVPVYMNPVALTLLGGEGKVDMSSREMRDKICEIVKIVSQSQNKPVVFNWQKNKFYNGSVKVLAPLRSSPLIFIVVRDVTLELNIQKMKEDFFHSVAHDLRSPLLNIQGYIKLLGRPELAIDKKSEYLEGLREESDKLFSMLEGILDMYRLESGAIRLNITEENIGDFLNKIMNSFSHLFEEKGISYEVKKPGKDVKFKADYGLLERAIINLINNAYKFTDKNGIIRLKGEILQDGSLLITVSDTWKGIIPEKQKYIFDKFKSYEKGGFGIGLNIAKAIVELHKGKIWVESEEGKGSSFFIKLMKYE